MVSISGIIRTVKSTQNFWTAILLRNTANKKPLKFRNGVEAEVDYTQYTVLRDWFSDLHERAFVIYEETDGYVIKNTAHEAEFDFKTHTIQIAKLFFESLIELHSKGWTIKRTGVQYLLKKDHATYTVEQVSDNTYRLKTGLLELLGPIEIIQVQLYECQEGLYEYDYSGKTVLDIGGFCGETAAYFSSKNANKVIVYEPFKEHHHFIKTNAQLNNVNIELHEAGIAEADAIISVNYDHAGLSFGLDRTGRKQTIIETRNISDVILQSKADVAKIDCEGAETSLTKVAPEVLGLIPYYFIETHTAEIEKALTAKFLASGFRAARQPVPLSEGISMHYFEKTIAD